MPSPISAYDVIRIAMGHIGVLAEGETPSADQATDGLRALNDVLETWSLQSLAVWGSNVETFATIAGQATYTMGPGGNWNTERPISVDGGFIRYQGVDFTIQPWTLAEYQAVGLKSLRQQIVERMVFVNDAPLAQVILYPTPAEALPITIDAPRILTQVEAVGSMLQMPPGYARALQYAVALELQPRYGTPIDVSAQARATMALIKRANRTPRIASFDATLYRNTGGFGSIYG